MDLCRRPCIADAARVTDSFALLDQPRRPWLDDEALREVFHRHAAAQHPDAPEGDAAAFAELNAAFAILRDPVPRLRHLLALEDPAALQRATPIPPDLADLFSTVATARQAILSFITRRSAATSALARALLAGDEATVRTKAATARAALDTARAQALAELHALDAGWITENPKPIAVLTALYGRFAFLEKWDGQLREAALALDLGR
jgi:hypothetical protein